MTCADAAHLLDAYLDGELGAPEAAAFSAHVGGCPKCGGAVEGRLALRRSLHRIPYYAAPDRLRATIAAKTRSSGRHRRFAVAAAAALVLAAGTFVAVRAVHLRDTTAAIADRVVADHIRALQTSRVFDVRSSDQHTVKPWFLGKIDYAPPVEDLAAAGFPLAGGRLATVDGRTVAVLVYQRRLHPITVFVWPETDTRTRGSDARAVRGFNVRHWTANGMAFWAVTDANAAELQELAKLLGSAG